MELEATDNVVLERNAANILEKQGKRNKRKGPSEKFQRKEK